MYPKMKQKVGISFVSPNIFLSAVAESMITMNCSIKHNVYQLAKLRMTEPLSLFHMK